MSTRRRKYSSFWPLPGGTEKYVFTLIKILEYIIKNNPTKIQLIKWIIEEFPKVTTDKNAGGYVNSMLRHSGLLVFRDKISLSENGIIFMNSKDNKLLFKIFDENILGFNEILRLLGNKSYNMKELHNDVVEALSEYNISWKTNAQPRWRINWLQSMGLVSVSGRQFYLSNTGKELLKELNMPSISVQKPIAESASISVSDKEDIIPTEKVLSVNNQVDKIIEDLEKFGHESSEPEKYEIAIMKAFKFLGYNAEHFGESGSTDVIAVANLGPWKYSMIIDGKTTKSNRVIERQISWPTIGDHRIKHGAKYAIIIGPDFAGGDLVRRSLNFKILLIKTETLITLIKIHSNTPISLLDFEEVFSKIGILNLEDCTKIMQIKDELGRQLDLIPKLLRKLQELQEQNEATTIVSLYWSLNRSYSNTEISKALTLLQNLEIIKTNERNEYVAILSSNVAALKLQLLREAIIK